MYCGRTCYLLLRNKCFCGAFFLFALFAVVFPLSAAAHGTGYRQLPGDQAVSVEFYYSTGEPMAFAEVMVFSPADSQVEHQNGRADRRGRFSFYPDCPGQWQIRVKDGMGHSVIADFAVAAPQKAAAGPVVLQESGRMPLPQAVVTGIGVILGVFGAMALFLGRGRKSNTP